MRTPFRGKKAELELRTLGVRTRLFREEGGNAEGLDHCGCACGRSLECREARESRQLLCATGRDVRVEYIETGKSVLFLGDHITKYKDRITLKSKDAYVDNMLAMLSMEGCKPTDAPMVRKESAANRDEELLEGPEAETYRSVVGILMYFKRHRFDLHYVAKSLAMASSSPTRGHMR